MKIIVILVSFVFLNGCVSAEFKRGVHPDEINGFFYDNKTYEITINTIKKEKIWVRFFQRTCGGYGLVGIIVPIIPVWDTIDCKNLEISISAADKVFVIYQNKSYKPESFDPKYHTYTFHILTKSLSDGAILVIEKDGQKFEIPFRYKHNFSFQLWGT